MVRNFQMIFHDFPGFPWKFPVQILTIDQLSRDMNLCAKFQLAVMTKSRSTSVENSKYIYIHIYIHIYKPLHELKGMASAKITLYVWFLRLMVFMWWRMYKFFWLYSLLHCIKFKWLLNCDLKNKSLEISFLMTFKKKFFNNCYHRPNKIKVINNCYHRPYKIKVKNNCYQWTYK